MSNSLPPAIGAMPQAVTPWLSVVIPSYRGESWIATALDSLAAQANDGIEILLVDGGPTAATVDIARRYADRLRLRIFERPDFTNWHSKTNFAVQAAAAAHVCWLGVDDVWLPGRAQAVHGWIHQQPDIPLHFAASMLIDQTGRSVGRWRCPLPPDKDLAPSFTLPRLLVQNFVAAPAPVFRRDAWIRCGGLDEQLWYTADWDVWLKLTAVGPVRYHDEATIGFRIHAGAQTVTGSRDTAEFGRQMQRVLDRHLDPAAGERGVTRRALASIEVNVALAAAAGGDYGRLPRAAWRVLSLGPGGVAHYLRDSRLWERVAPRARAKLSGNF